MFVDGNFDEDSRVLDEPKSKFDNIDIDLSIDKAGATMSMFNMTKDFANSFDRITDKLPGYNLPIVLDPKAKKKEMKHKSVFINEI